MTVEGFCSPLSALGSTGRAPRYSRHYLQGAHWRRNCSILDSCIRLGWNEEAGSRKQEAGSRRRNTEMGALSAQAITDSEEFHDQRGGAHGYTLCFGI